MTPAQVEAFLLDAVTAGIAGDEVQASWGRTWLEVCLLEETAACPASELLTDGGQTNA